MTKQTSAEAGPLRRNSEPAFLTLQYKFSGGVLAFVLFSNEAAAQSALARQGG